MASSVATGKPVRIAFLLTLNGRALRQVKRLLKVLFNVNHYFFIHVDSVSKQFIIYILFYFFRFQRQDYLFRELLHLERRFPNVKLSRLRFATIWGGASLLKMLLSSMKDLLTLPWKWDFVINLSESDYPVKPTSKLTDFLSANRDRNFVKSHGREVQRFIQKQGLDKTFVECDAHMWRTGDRQLPWGVQIDGGSDWVALSRDFVEYVVSQTPDSLVEGLLVVFEHTLLPAESFFHTVLRNSKFCHTYIDNNLHVTNWKRKLGCKCQYKHVVDWCGCSPNDFKPEDWARIQSTEARQLFFARKFEPVVNQAVILQLEQWLLKDEPKQVANLKSYWQSVYNYLDLSPPPEDSLLTVAESASRLRTKLISSSNCPLKAGRILEVTSYHNNDSFTSALILYEAFLQNDRKVLLETTLKPRSAFKTLKSTNLTARLKQLSVSTDYDQKEQLFRNFLQILGPYSEPVLGYTFASSPGAKSANLTLLWVDPAGKLAEISELFVDDSHAIGHVTLQLKPPLLPGVWTLKLLQKLDQPVAETRFLVTPLYYLSNNVVSQKEVRFLHGGGADFLKDFDDARQFRTFLPAGEERDTLENLAEANSKRFGPDLLEWIDSLVGKFYDIGHVCVANNYTEVCGIKIQKCTDTRWSSFAPDPKSYLGNVNDTTGTFDIW